LPSLNQQFKPGGFAHEFSLRADGAKASFGEQAVWCAGG
jgi:hypothetical protein